MPEWVPKPETATHFGHALISQTFHKCFFAKTYQEFVLQLTLCFILRLFLQLFRLIFLRL